MATETRTRGSISPSLAGIVPFRLTDRQFQEMVDSGTFCDRERVTLIDGLPAIQHPDGSTPSFDGVPLSLIDGSQYQRLIGAETFSENDPIELLGGVLARKMSKYPPHSYAVRRMSNALREIFGPGWVISEEKPVELARYWHPEPDVAVARGPDDRYHERDPAAADLALVVEVALTSQPTDRGAKSYGYAAAGVPVSWVVDLAERVVDVYSDPGGDGEDVTYRQSAKFGRDDEVPVLVQGRQVGSVAVRDVLP